MLERRFAFIHWGFFSLFLWRLKVEFGVLVMEKHSQLLSSFKLWISSFTYGAESRYIRVIFLLLSSQYLNYLGPHNYVLVQILDTHTPFLNFRCWIMQANLNLFALWRGTLFRTWRESLFRTWRESWTMKIYFYVETVCLFKFLEVI